MAELVVELHGTRIGTLKGDWRTFDLEFEPGAVRTFGIDSPILSVAVRLAVVPTRAHKQKRRNFFQELLPEGRKLKRLAQQANLSESDTIGLLGRYGRDVAGALQVWDPDVPGEPRQPRLEPLDEAGVAELLENVQAFPLGNKPRGGKSSLAGVQDKIVLAHTAEGWHRALDGYPSSHILKPVPEGLPTVIYDEEYGARLARAVGLIPYRTWIQDFSGVPALVIERYDRSPDAPQARLHQEDFNQALGASGDEKYQRYGGKVSLERVARVLEQHTRPESREKLLRMVVLAAAVGNVDMHAKNISLIHPHEGTVELAPAYDFVPQAHQRNDGEMALAVAGEYRHAHITRGHLIEEAHSWGLAEPEPAIDEALDTVLETVRHEEPHARAYPTLTADISGFTQNLLEGRAAGLPTGAHRS